jgi:diguanylate cyclase (GGDEF)-like protein
VHGTSSPFEDCPHQRALETGSAVTTEILEPLLGIYLEVSCSPIFREDGTLGGTVHIAKDITIRKKLEKKLTQMATLDGLTGLPNRMLLKDRFDVALAGALRNNEGLALMMLDFDHFKSINDSYGHGVGDMLLVAATGRLTALLRKSDTVARMGGDEFAILLPEMAPPEDAVKTAQKILAAFREPFALDGRVLTTTVSIGIARYPTDGEDMETLFKNADAAMYLSKDAGRNTYKLYGVDNNP